MPESAKCQALRALIKEPEASPAWYQRVLECLPIPLDALKSEEILLNTWNNNWGLLAYKDHKLPIGDATKDVILHRTDDGPPLMDVSEKPVNEKLLRMALIGELILELKASGLVTYVEVGKPAEWRKCEIFLNGVKLELVIWACAVTEQCEIGMQGRTRSGVLQTRHLTGKVLIQLGKTDPGFF